MRYASKHDLFLHDLVSFTKENWFEVALLCLWMSAMFWFLIEVFKF